MGLLEHSVAWARGEIFDGVAMGVFGVGLVGVGVASRLFGGMQLTRALGAPLVVAGLIFAAGGVSAYVGNSARVEAFRAAHQADPTAFALDEKARVEGFAVLYAGTKIVAPILFAVASALFIASTAPTPRAIAMVLCLLGLGGLVVDGFSKERADAYYAEITAELARTEGGSR